MNIFLKSTAARVVGRGYLSSDHISTATGLDPAITISKNGGAFANPAAGASVMTEIEATGWYYFALGSGDVDTLGPLIIRATHATMDNIEVACRVVETVTAANLTHILGTALTETSGYLAAAFKKFFNIATPTGTVNSLPDAVAGAANGLTTTNGTKQIQTVDLTAGQTIAATVAGSVGSVTAGVTVTTNNDKTGYTVSTVSDKTGYSLSSTGADAILKSSTFVQAIVAAVNEFANYGLAALNTLLVTTGIKAATIPAATLAASQHVIVDSGTVTTLTNAPADMALNSTVAKDATVSKPGIAQTITAPVDMALNSTVAKESTLATVAGYIDTEIGTIITAVGTTILNAIAVLPTDADVNAACDSAIVDAGLTSGGIADAVWDEVLHVVHEVAGSASVLLQSAGSASDPWLTSLPGAYGAGTAGDLIGNNLAIASADPLLNAVPGTYAAGTAGYALGTSPTVTIKNRVDMQSFVNIEMFMGDTGEIRLTTGINTVPYTTKQIKFTRPNGTTGHWDAATDPNDNTCIIVTCNSSTLTMPGMWKVQTYLSNGNEILHGQRTNLIVLAPIA
jgi:hypothetical protein